MIQVFFHIYSTKCKNKRKKEFTFYPLIHEYAHQTKNDLAKADIRVDMQDMPESQQDMSESQ
jgi:hypothetical protein